MSLDVGRLFLEAPYRESTVAVARLRPIDARWLETWLTDPKTTRYMATGRVPASVEQIAAQIDAWKEPKDCPFAVLRYGVEPVGTAGLYDVDWITRKAEFRILIGAPYCNQGIGTVATRLMLRFGFERLNLNRIWLGVNTANTGAVRAYLKAGFMEEGILAEDLYRDGVYYHSMRMATFWNVYKEKRDSWDTERVKPAGTSAPGPATAKPAGEPSIGSSQPGVA